MVRCHFWTRIRPPRRLIGSPKRQGWPLKRLERDEEEGKWKKKGKGRRRKPAASSSVAVEDEVGRL
jgi:hypothetical protein